MPLQTVRDTLVATLAASSLMRLAMVLGTGLFSANALRLCLLAAPLVFALSCTHPAGRGPRCSDWSVRCCC